MPATRLKFPISEHTKPRIEAAIRTKTATIFQTKTTIASVARKTAYERAALRSMGITHPDDIQYVRDAAKRLGIAVEEAAVDEFVKSNVKAILLAAL
jgi:hypothetical protein